MLDDTETYPTATWTTAEGSVEVYVLEDDGGDHLLVEETTRKGTWYAHRSQLH